MGPHTPSPAPIFCGLLAELLEYLDTNGNDKDTTQNRQGNRQNSTDRAGHLTSNSTQSSGQSSGDTSSFHNFLLSYQLIVHRAKADITLFIKLAKMPRNRPKANPDNKTEISSTMDPPEQKQTAQRAADQKRTE